MSNTKKKTKRNTISPKIVSKSIVFPDGTLIESFKKYLQNNDNPDEAIIEFLGCKNAQLLCKCDNLDNFSSENREELYEFYRYFMEKYGDKTYKLRMQNWGGIEPLIFRLTETLFEEDCEKRDEAFMKNVDKNIIKEAESLSDKMFSIKKDKHFACITSYDSWEFWIKGNVPKQEKDEAKQYMTLSFAKIIADDGLIIARITEKGRMDKMFGIEGLDKKWASISKKKVKKADNISQRRLGIKEDIEYIEINRD